MFAPEPRRMLPETIRDIEEKGFSLRTFEDKVKVEVAKEDIAAFVDSFVHQDMELAAIEPKRFTLEDFFMGIINTTSGPGSQTGD